MTTSLKREYEINVYHDGEVFVATEENGGDFATGRTANEALQFLVDQLKFNPDQSPGVFF